LERGAGKDLRENSEAISGSGKQLWKIAAGLFYEVPPLKAMGTMRPWDNLPPFPTSSPLWGRV